MQVQLRRGHNQFLKSLISPSGRYCSWLNEMTYLHVGTDIFFYTAGFPLRRGTYRILVTPTQSGVGMNWYDRFSDFPRSPFQGSVERRRGDGMTGAARRDTPKRDVALIGRNDFQNNINVRLQVLATCASVRKKDRQINPAHSPRSAECW